MVFNILRNLSVPTILLLLVAVLEGRNFDQKLHLREQILGTLHGRSYKISLKSLPPFSADFDHSPSQTSHNVPLLCREGVASVIHESAEQLPEKPSIVVVSVGGGGLLSGVLQGMHSVGWTDVPVVAMETKGADSFNASVQAGELVTLDAITRFVEKKTKQLSALQMSSIGSKCK